MEKNKLLVRINNDIGVGFTQEHIEHLQQGGRIEFQLSDVDAVERKITLIYGQNMEDLSVNVKEFVRDCLESIKNDNISYMGNET